MVYYRPSNILTNPYPTCQSGRIRNLIGPNWLLPKWQLGLRRTQPLAQAAILRTYHHAPIRLGTILRGRMRVVEGSIIWRLDLRAPILPYIRLFPATYIHTPMRPSPRRPIVHPILLYYEYIHIKKEVSLHTLYLEKTVARKYVSCSEDEAL
jgi:hypothetical protein